MNQAIKEVIDYLFHNGEQENFIEYMTEEKGRNPKEHIFYSALVMRYNGDEKEIRTWMRENIPQEDEDKGTTVENLSYLIQDKIAEAQQEYVEDGETYTIPNIYANAKKMRTYLQTAEMFLCRNNKFFGVSLKYNSTKYCIEFALTKHHDDDEDNNEDEDEDEEDFDSQWYIGSLENDEEIICWSSYEAAGTAILKKKPTIARNSQ
jgi:hypothetical protein